MLDFVFYFIFFSVGTFWEGIEFSLLLLTFSVISTLFDSQATFQAFVIGQIFRSTLTSVTYRQILRLDNDSIMQLGAGQMINLITVDTSLSVFFFI
jgi:ABC-type multidrug transport system fused ATPase/permease subunit